MIQQKGELMTIKDIAKLSGYSIGTVSRVINNRSDVSDEAREKIMAVIEQENFQPNANAKHLKQTRTSAITIVIKGNNNIFLNALLEKVQQNLKANGEESSILFVDEADNEVRAAIQAANERNPKGFLFLGGALENFRLDFHEINVPSVLVAGSARDLNFDNLSSFCTDDYVEGAEAMDLLVSHGHRKILIVGGFVTDEAEQVSAKRLSGALSILKKHKIPFNVKKQYIESAFSMQDAYIEMKKALKKNPDVTAVFALSDLIAIGTLRAVIDEGKRVPEDISIIGFDGIDYTEFTIPRLTTVKQDIDFLATRSVENLLFRISYNRPSLHEYIPATITANESVNQIND